MIFNFRRFSLFSIAAILSLSIVSGVVSITPPVMAAPNPPNPSGKLEQQINIDAVLKLTDAQKQKIRKITTERGKQILTVLTPSQRDRFTTAVKKGQPAVPVLQSLDLNPDRKKKNLAKTLTYLYYINFGCIITSSEINDLFYSKGD